MQPYTLELYAEELHELYNFIKQVDSVSETLQNAIINTYNADIGNGLSYIEQNIDSMTAKFILLILEEVGYRYKINGPESPEIDFIELIEVLRDA